MISEKAFWFPFKDKDWVSKFLIGSLFILASWVIPVLPLIFVLGYIIRAMREAIRTGESQLPDWQDWTDLGVRGVLCLLLYCIYLLPGLVLLFGALASFGLGIALNGVTPDDAAHLITTPMVLLARLWLLIGVAALASSVIALLAGLLAAPIAVARLAATGELSAALEIGRIWAIIRAQIGNFIMVWAVYLGLVYVSSILYTMLYYTVCCCLLIPIVSAPVSLYLLIFSSTLFALVYREGEGVTSAEPLYLPASAGPKPIAETPPAPPSDTEITQASREADSPVPSAGEQKMEIPREVADMHTGEERRISDRSISSEVTINELKLPPRVERLLLENGFVTVGQVVRSLERDDSELLGIKGFGTKALDELKTQLQARGFLN